MTGTRIIVADDHQLMRQGLKTMLIGQGLNVIAEAGDGRTTVALARQHCPDVVIMDISMPDLNGIDATRQILAGKSKIKVIALSMHSDRRFVTEVLKAGATGYLLKDCAFEELEQAIRAVLASKVYLSPAVAGGVVDSCLAKMPARDSNRTRKLTPREREVLQLLSEGRSTKEIATQLEVSGKTIETHRRRIMDKLHIYTVAELTKYAIREGLTSTAQ